MPRMRTARQRQTWMDFLRGAAVIMVVLLHASLATDGENGWVIHTLLRPFRMPTLMVLSGLLLHRSLRKGLGPYVSGKVRGIVWPWLVWIAILGLLLTDKARADPVDFLTVGTNLWFLGALALSYALALAVRRVPAVATAAALFLLADLAQEPFGALATYLWYSGFFFAGAALRPVVERWLTARPVWPLLMTAVAVVGALGQIPRGMHVPYGPDQVLLSMAGILAAIWLASRLPRIAPIRAVEWIGRNSIVTYLAHTALLVPVGLAVSRLGLGPAPSTVVTFVVVFAGCVALTYVRPWTDWLYRLPVAIAEAKPSGRDATPVDRGDRTDRAADVPVAGAVIRR